jgi:hypothetical protein
MDISEYNAINADYDDTPSTTHNEVLSHPGIDTACKILGVQKDWINTSSFYIWPMKSFTGDTGVTYDIKCGYVFSSFKAIVINFSDDLQMAKKSMNKKSNFIYFYGKCVVNPQAPTTLWQFENWGWKSTDASPNVLTHNLNNNDNNDKKINKKKRDSMCCWGFFKV